MCLCLCIYGLRVNRHIGRASWSKEIKIIKTRRGVGEFRAQNFFLLHFFCLLWMMNFNEQKLRAGKKSFLKVNRPEMRNRCFTAAHLSHLKTKKEIKKRSVRKVDLNLKLIYFAAVSTCYFVQSSTADVQSGKSKWKKEIVLLLMLRHISATWIGNYKNAEAQKSWRQKRRRW